MCGEAYLQSARICRGQMGPFDGYAVNREPHAARDRASIAPARTRSTRRSCRSICSAAARDVWDEALALGREHGVRNSQVTVLAPTGTIAFMMDCDTTGVEPDIALVKYKKLVGGGMLKIVNKTVPRALRRLGYESREVQSIVEYIDEQETIEGAPHLKDEHLPVFDCAFKPARGVRAIHPRPPAHDGRGAAVHLGRDLEDHQHAGAGDGRRHRAGLHRGVAARCEGGRDLPRRLQADAAAQHRQAREGGGRPSRRRRPGRCAAACRRTAARLCHKFDIAGHEGYIHVGFYEDGTPGEIFIKMAKEGSTISGLMDTIGVLTSMALQYGVPLEVLVTKFSHVRFEPSGFTKNPEIPMAKSLIDYIFRFLGARFLSGEQRVAVGTGRARRRERGRAGDPDHGDRRCVDRNVDALASHTIGFAAGRASANAPITFSPAGRCAELSGLRLDHGAQRRLLQVLQLRGDERLLVVGVGPARRGRHGIPA